MDWLRKNGEFGHICVFEELVHKLRVLFWGWACSRTFSVMWSRGSNFHSSPYTVNFDCCHSSCDLTWSIHGGWLNFGCSKTHVIVIWSFWLVNDSNRWNQCFTCITLWEFRVETYMYKRIQIVVKISLNFGSVKEIVKYSKLLHSRLRLETNRFIYEKQWHTYKFYRRYRVT